MSTDTKTCPSPRLHGDESAYKYGCRCPAAREDGRLKRKRRREGRHIPGDVPPFGTARRIQALAALGWSADVLGERAGCRPNYVRYLRVINPNATVHRTTADLWAHIYDELSGTPGGSKRAKTWAAKHGYVVPLLWEGVDIDDPNAEPVRDEPVPFRGAGVLDEVQFLTRAGVTLEQAALRVGTTEGAIRQAQLRAARKRSAA